MSRKFIVFVAVCLTICAAAIYLKLSPSVSRSPSQTTVISSAQPVSTVSAPSTPASDLAPTDSAAPVPTTDVAQTKTNADNMQARPETHDELMARLRAWAATNWESALEFVSKMPEGSERDDALQAVCFGLAQKDPARAVDLSKSLQEPDNVTENLVQQWAGKDLPKALAWINNNQPAGDVRDDMLQRIVLLLSPDDPSDAAGLIFEQIPAGSAQDEAIMTLLHQWANKDLKSAAKWVENFPDGPLKERAVAELEGIQKYQKDLATGK